MISRIRLYFTAAALSAACAQTIVGQDDRPLCARDGSACITPSAIDAAEMAATSLINEYIDHSVESVVQGHRQAFADFRSWYHTRLQRRGSSARATGAALRVMLTTAVAGGLTLIFPEGTAFIVFLRTVATQAFQVAAQHLADVPDDEDGYVNAQQQLLEQYVSDLLGARARLVAEGSGLISQATTMFLLTYGTARTSEVPAPVRALLNRDDGVPEPGEATTQQFRERFLAFLIRGVISQSSPIGGQSYGASDLDIAARARAFVYLHPDHADRFCDWVPTVDERWRQSRPRCMEYVRSIQEE